MNKSKQQQIEDLISKTFSGISELKDLLDGEVSEWAAANWEDNDVAESIVNIGDNLRDWGNEF